MYRKDRISNAIHLLLFSHATVVKFIPCGLFFEGTLLPFLWFMFHSVLFATTVESYIKRQTKRILFHNLQKESYVVGCSSSSPQGSTLRWSVPSQSAGNQKQKKTERMPLGVFWQQHHFIMTVCLTWRSSTIVLTAVCCPFSHIRFIRSKRSSISHVLSFTVFTKSALSRFCTR